MEHCSSHDEGKFSRGDGVIEMTKIGPKKLGGKKLVYIFRLRNNLGFVRPM
jgi:hypothetical protein